MALCIAQQRALGLLVHVCWTRAQIRAFSTLPICHRGASLRLVRAAQHTGAASSALVVIRQHALGAVCPWLRAPHTGVARQTFCIAVGGAAGQVHAPLAYCAGAGDAHAVAIRSATGPVLPS